MVGSLLSPLPQKKMSKEIKCELLDSARALAKKKGLPFKEVICAEDNICDGSFCALMIDTIPTEFDSRPSPVEVFNARLEKTIRGR